MNYPHLNTVLWIFQTFFDFFNIQRIPYFWDLWHYTEVYNPWQEAFRDHCQFSLLNIKRIWEKWLTEGMKRSIKTPLKRDPDCYIHVGTNDVWSSQDQETIAENIIDIAKNSNNYKNKTLISTIVPYRDNLNVKVAGLINCYLCEPQQYYHFKNPTNGQRLSNNSSATADKLLECVWPFCRVGA